MAVALMVIVPLTVEFDTGDVMDTVGGAAAVVVVAYCKFTGTYDDCATATGKYPEPGE